MTCSLKDRFKIKFALGNILEMRIKHLNIKIFNYKNYKIIYDFLLLITFWNVCDKLYLQLIFTFMNMYYIK